MKAPGLSARSLADVLQTLRPRIPRALLDGGGWRRLQACAHGLPSAAALTGFCLEFRCESPDPAADLGLLTSRGCAISRHYIALGEAEGADAAAVALSTLFHAAEGDDTPLSRAVGALSLEFDVARRNWRGAAPGVFVSPPEYLEDPSTGYTSPGRLMTALTAAGCARHTGNRRAIDAVCAALPPGANVSQGGLFPGREPPIIRINIAGAENADMSAFLRRLGWPGAPEPAVDILSAFRDLAPCFRFALDIHDGRIAPRLGLEMFQEMPRHGLGGDADAWRRFIDRLEERCLCRPDKAAGLRAWPGWEPVFDRTGAYTALRTFHHFKFDMRDEKLAARAYVFVLFGASAA